MAKLPRILILATMFGLAFSCSSTDEQGGDAGETLTPASEEQGGEETNDATDDEFVEGAESGEDYTATEGDEKVPIPDDGYDDDWNNMGTQQQLQQQKTNNKQVAKQNQGNNYNLEYQEQTQPNQGEQYAQQTVTQYEPPLDQAVPQYEPAPEPVADYAAAPPPEPIPAPVVETPILPEAGTPLIKGEVLPEIAELWWVGYDFTETDGFVRIELVTRGSPKFNVFQERNQNDQPELVVRFFDTMLRSKVRRDIDASEFRSPVAFVRMRADREKQHVDVILTMRDAVQPRLYAEDGNVLMTFPVPDYYFGNQAMGDVPIAQAEALPNAAIMPTFDPGSELPEGLKVAQAYVPDPAAAAFDQVPVDGGEAVQPGAMPTEGTAEELPGDFDNYGAGENTSTAYENANPVDYGTNTATNTGGENYGDNYSGNYGENYGGNTGGNTAGGTSNYGEDYGANYGETAGENVEIETGAGNYGGNQYTDDGYEQYDDYGGDQQQAPAGNYEEEGGEYDQEVDEDAVEDYDYEEGAGDDIDKFEVRIQSFRFFSVAQDNYGDYSEDYGGNYGGENTGAEATGTENTGAADGGDYGGDDYGGADPVNATLDGGEGGEGYGTNTATGDGVADYGGGGDGYGDDAGMFDDGGGDYAAGDAGFGTETGGNTATSTDTTTQPADFTTTTTGGGNYATPTDYGGGYSTADPTEYGGDIVGQTEPVPPVAGDSTRRIELDFENAPLAAVIKTLSEESGVNFILSQAATQSTVSIKMSGISFNDALKAILDANGLGLVEIGPNLIRIDTLAAIAQAEQSKLQAAQAEALRRPTQILVHRLSYARATDVQAVVTSLATAISNSDPRVSTTVDERTNSLIINAPPTTHSTIKALLERIDLETPQVKIASRIVEVNSSDQSRFGVSFGGPINYDQSRGLGFGALPFPNYMRANYAIDAGGGDAGNGNFRFFFGSINDVTSLDLALSMAETLSNIEILQTSDVIVEDNTQATITAGGSDVFLKPPGGATFVAGGGQGGGAGGGQPAFDSLDYNMELQVTPRVTADGRVQMEINLTSTTPGNQVSAASDAATDNRSITTSLLRQSGETAVIGGVYNTTRSKTQAGIPGLKDLPLIGALFRSTREQESKKELMILVTPTILGRTTTTGAVAAAPAASGGDYSGNYSTQGYQGGGGNYDGNYSQNGYEGGGDGYDGNYEDASINGGNGGQQGGDYQQAGESTNQGNGGDYGGDYQGQQGGNTQSTGQQGGQNTGQGGNYEGDYNY